MKSLLLTFIICFTGFASDLKSQTATDGEMTFSVRTVTANGNFSPRHVLAIWVEDQAGFVLTRKLSGEDRKQYLYTWNSNAGGNVVDATTGPTLTSHQTHSVTWDCRNLNGELVPDGEYTVFVEFTEEHAQGPLRMVTFTKGSEMVSMAPADDANFKDIELLFEPVVTLTASYTYSVEDLAVTFTNTSTGAESYSWDFGDGNSSTAESPVHTFAGAGTYTVVLTAVAGLESVTDEQSITVSSSAALTASYTYSADDLAVTFTNTSTGAESYSWDFGDGNSSTTESPVHTFADAGTYTVVLTAVAGMESVTDEQSITVSSALGLGNTHFDAIQIYPNPTHGIVRINLKDHTGDTSVKIFDLKGSLVYSDNMRNPGLYFIDISDNENGTYVIQVDSEHQSSRQMIIKE